MSLGWLTESALIPKESKPIDVPDSSISKLKALTYDAEARKTLKGTKKVRLTREEETNAGVEARRARDLEPSDEPRRKKEVFLEPFEIDTGDFGGLAEDSRREEEEDDDDQRVFTVGGEEGFPQQYRVSAAELKRKQAGRRLPERQAEEGPSSSHQCSSSSSSASSSFDMRTERDPPVSGAASVHWEEFRRAVEDFKAAGTGESAVMARKNRRKEILAKMAILREVQGVEDQVKHEHSSA
uniref:Uncharacterized protein n=1 Tax=Chromera velia CCMP2878 TaxID=1169474 RepID=A0A0G4FR46_9ALVE|mmetsp:Transcript_33039/g.65495  ORF Transcript_33039/g.65495 Transcript_33039/m.65495 type:complete len:240 (+) Transcript_33039:314-1033(+)|eukprot:Cvel_18315.t1-p1 / transcript=Cvel_18315.t1 / gene=Cvel_18315 / organism=Chromera_velia_CCMP2878 / gene_product=hypothetical protein / transcript_product=hypothetical protein / location=Cvel_scaffold1511:27346-28949(-) / protein_length=239 / sequence_SO=supercontig / SO=protein_coding / is_pseudo=false